MCVWRLRGCILGVVVRGERHSGASAVIRGRRWRSTHQKQNIERIRNIGIVAHIDAGKTTTTERMLYYTGVTHRMGDVDNGNTVTDHMEQERERGITITSAAVTMDWEGHRINLIDTPGHVDFMFEVKRSLKVLDGAVAIFDGSAGVEAQTVQVWKQANQFKIPRIAFVNKMDKPAASLSATVAAMKRQLKATPLVLQLPIGQAHGFRGVIDLVTMTMMLWEPGSDGDSFSKIPLVGEDGFSSLPSLPSLPPDLSSDNSVMARAVEERAELTDRVLTLDTDLLEEVFAVSADPVTLPPHQLQAAIRSLTLSCAAVPVLCGSAFRKTGVQPLLTAITHYLPSPLQAAVHVPPALRSLCAYAFKVTHSRQRGAMVYLRLYSGLIRTHSTVYNIVSGKEERVSRLLMMLADEQHEVKEMAEGNIVVAVGLKHTSTGDTIVHSPSAARAAQREELSAVLDTVEPPPPVFFCSVEPSSNAQQKELEHALSCLSLEDPSLRVSVDQETGQEGLLRAGHAVCSQTILSGMGALHLDIIHQRLLRDFRVDCVLGRLQVAYRESPTVRVTTSGKLRRSLGGKSHSVDVSLSLLPVNSVTIDPTVTFSSGCAPSEEGVAEAVRIGVQSACAQGPLLAFPVVGVGVEVTELAIAVGTSPAMVSACVSDTAIKALKDSSVQLMEPLIQLEVSVPEVHVGGVLADLTSSRRGQVQEVTPSLDDGRCVSALVPLACLSDYSTFLRTLTSGTGSFSALYCHHAPVSRAVERTIVEQIRGYLPHTGE